ncbi:MULTISPECIES: hypothetical protein [Spirosoma]|uniref:Uncharacterized protein n=1 Tax=Spirosoma sordidisoli TaxID=2502893 RepID=A0A4Q2UJW6_9BACT|nr:MULTISPECIES: hypothetical protein [Spirosoma]RYC69797.1 hypothetical protein EQG79_14475 [Spirosoma sordidisoli]
MSAPPKHLPDRYKLDELVTSDLQIAVRLAHVGHDAHSLADDVQAVHRHFNKPQLRSMLVGANEEYAVWGRGTGKSEGLIAPRTFRNVEVMPRGHGCFVGSTYLQLLERTLPPVIKGWEQMGWVRGRDFWVRERPPKKLNVPQPIVGPITTEHCIFFRNGAVASMVSQDRPGSANGKTVHWIAGDEAKFLDKAKLDNELLLTNRGDERYFGGIPEFHSLLFCTDMPTSKAAMWILEEEKRMIAQSKELGFDRIKAILDLRTKIYALYEGLIAYPGKRASILKKIQTYQTRWDAIRSNTVYFSEASTLDNIHGFGAKNIARLREKLPPFIFETAILNRRPFLTENAFYPDLDEHHFYDEIDYGFIDSFDFDQFGKGLFEDSRKDADVDKYRPLDVALDYGAHINPLLVGQPHGRDYRVLKEMYVRHPDRVVDVARAFCRYYKHHPVKVINYFFDHTAIGTSATSATSPKDVFAEYLMSEGWTVEDRYVGHTPEPAQRYELWGRALRGGDARLFRVGFNRNNTEFVRISMQQAQIAQGSTGFRKDKKDEKNHNLDQRETTHFSDAADTLLYGAHLLHRFESDSRSFDGVFMS